MSYMIPELHRLNMAYRYNVTGLPVYPGIGTIFFRGLYYANGRWILLMYTDIETVPPLGSVGTWVWESLDGVNFTKKGLLSTSSLTDTRELVYGNGYYILASYTLPGLYVSSDLVTWSRTVLAPTANIDIVFDGIRFVVIVGTSTSYYTVDGVNLTAKTGLANNPQCICYGNNTWVVITSDATGQVWSCQGDITSDPWVQRTISPSIPNASLYNICFDGSTFISFCPYGRVLRSTNGLSFNYIAQKGQIKPLAAAPSRKLRWNTTTGLFITNAEGYFITSPDGISWRTIPATSSVGTSPWLAVDTYGKTLFAQNFYIWKVL